MMDEIRQVFIVDRKKDMINTAGIFPAEIERIVAPRTLGGARF
jgi:acyl-CoA synthetase (AMP-forming)/AMP-acid ligase II